MTYLVLLGYSIVFVELFILLGIITDAQDVLKLSGRSLEVMKSSTMSDREKESFMRTNSLTMFLTTIKFIGKFLAIFASLFGLHLVVNHFSSETASLVSDSFTSLPIIVMLTAATLLYVWIRNVIRKKL